MKPWMDSGTRPGWTWAKALRWTGGNARRRSAMGVRYTEGRFGYGGVSPPMDCEAAPMDWRSRRPPWCSNPSAWREDVRVEALAALAQNRHPSCQDLASGSKLVKIEDRAQVGPRSPQNKVSRFLTSKPGAPSGPRATWRTSKRGGETEEDQDVIVAVQVYHLHFSPSGHL